MLKGKENLARLLKTPVLMRFIKRHKGNWDHKEWQGLCLKLEEKGYTPIDFDQVGMKLEEKKAQFLAKQGK